jgi:hypothetical protein
MAVMDHGSSSGQVIADSSEDIFFQMADRSSSESCEAVFSP